MQAELEEAEQLAAMEAVAVAVALEAVADWAEAVADWEAEAEHCYHEETLTAREAAARKEATATPDGQAADGQNKIFDPGGCVPLAVAGGRRWRCTPRGGSRSRRWRRKRRRKS